MDAFKTWLATTFWGTTAKSFVAVVLALAVAEWKLNGSFTFGSWQAWVLGAVVSLAPGVINHLNDKDTRYGRGKANARRGRGSGDGPTHAAL